MPVAAPRRRSLTTAVAVGLVALLAALAVVLPAAPPAAAADPPTSVTVAGSLQSELGCADDWQPDCARSGLMRDATDGVWTSTLVVPAAGSYEYKVALNGGWTENYGRGGQANGPNIPLTTSEPDQQVRFYYDEATHWATDDVGSAIATAAGDFQSELGCPGDWDPGCLRSWLQDADGDGTYTFATDGLPTGTYAFKVARDEGWAENYGAGGVPNGANVEFSVTAPATVTFTYRPSDGHAVEVDVQGQGTGPLPGDEALLAESLRTGLSGEKFYFVLPDRFANGDTSNDTAGVAAAEGRLVHGLDPTDKGFYHGGDLAGLRAKLDYLEDLAITAIWMTPMFRNRWVQGEGDDVSAGYHGYWTTDFTRLDPHFGTTAEMRALIADAHGRGMKVFFDIITNHTADVIEHEEGVYTYRSKGAHPYVDAQGREFDDADYAGTEDFPRLTRASFPYTPVVPDDLADVKVPAWLNNPIYYHNRGDSTFAGESSQYGDFFGLDDLFTEHPRVADGMVDIFQSWIDRLQIDGYRIDTVKHVNDEFWQEFAPAIEAYAASKGREFFAFGEVFDGNQTFTSRYTTENKLEAVLDFPFQGAAQRFAAGGASNNLRTFFAADDLYTDADSNAYALPTFLGNHDMGRLASFLRSTDQTLQRVTLAHSLMYLVRGNPVVYYGDEQGFVGDGGDKDARQDMFASQVASYNDDDLLGTDETTADDNFDPDHPLYQHVASLGALTAGHPALREGLQQHRLSGSGPGIYAFSRLSWDEGVEYVVAVNNATTEKTASVPTYSAGMDFDGLWPAGTPDRSSDGSRELDVTVPPLSAVVYRATGTVADPASAPGVGITAPAAGTEVEGGRTAVTANVSGNAPQQVTFAARTAGTDDWTVLGTDDNRPYSVHADLVDLFGEDVAVELRAVAQDRAGAYNGDTVTVLTGDVPPTPTPGAGQTEYLVVHYQREDGQYDDWGLHAFGDVETPTEWAAPVPFAGGDEYGGFAWVKVTRGADSVGLVVHSGDTKDPADAPDRFVDPRVTPEVWLKQGDARVYGSLAEARGFERIHYQRPDDQYDGWGVHLWGDALDESVKTQWASPRPFDGTDAFGAYVDVPIENADGVLNFIIHKGDVKDPGPDESVVPSATSEVRKVSGDTRIHATRAAAEQKAVIHYHRPDGDYGDATSDDYADFWGLHVWNGAADPTEWTQPLKPVRTDRFGVVFEVPLADDAPGLNFILHRGEAKDPSADQLLDLATYGNEVYYVSGQTTSSGQISWLLPSVLRGPAADLSKQTAHWVAEDTVLWDVDASATRAYRLRYSPTGEITAGADGVRGGDVLRLSWDPDGMTDEMRAAWPHLAGYEVFTVRSADLGRVPAALRSQLAAVEVDDSGILVTATGVQIPGVLDDLYAAEAADVALGPDIRTRATTVRLWAPTAQSVRLRLYGSGSQGADQPTQSVPMRRDRASGVWTASGSDWQDRFYLFEVTVWAPSVQQVVTNLVTDPYALALSADSTKSQLVDLDDARTKPAGWNRLRKQALAQPEDVTVYELHVRDFSVGDETLREDERGTYLAFTEPTSAGMTHLRALAAAGMNHLHLLPAFDLATVPERRADQEQPACDLSALTAAAGGRSSDAQQACVEGVRDSDGFNWGYDPFHYGVPEGSYATDPDGWQRTRQFRQMVQGVNGAGLRVVMDVVYNHTTAAGQDSRSVLDRIVPGYYQRLMEDGTLATSTCCANTATEHRMMGKLMVDTLVRWARDYKVDGFRFDLMGHHSKQNLLDVRAALDALTPSRDGVDGKSIYLYGEGWNFGEVANDARFVQATQLNMAGTGIGTFTDRLRDAVRGGGPFDENPRVQGFGTGLFTDPNGDAVNGTEAQQKDRLLLDQDQIKVGLAGNLKDFELVDRTGATVTGKEVRYNEAPAGYAADPSETVTYVDAHDNETLYDASAMKLPVGTARADRVRMNTVALATTALSQGVSFWHAGADILRSKSLDRNSYNSGDWFNRVDWTLGDNTFGSGLPPQGDNASKRAYHQPLLADPALDPNGVQMRTARDRATELLRIRFSSPLFRLGSADLISERVDFPIGGPTQAPGVVVMTLDDGPGRDLDFRWEGIVVVLNASDEATTQRVPGTVGDGYRLHPVQARGGDPVVKTATYAGRTGEFSVPARTVAVFVRS